MTRLRIINPDGTERLTTLTEAEYVVGRDGRAGIQLEDGKVSRRHARLLQKGGQYWVEDCGSANGVRLDGQTLTGAAPLAQGVFEIAGFCLVLAPPPIAAVTLVGISEPATGQQWALEAGDYVVGRTEDAAITLAHPSISRQHARLIVTPDTLRIEDLASSNGCFVDGQKVQQSIARPGQRIRFGRVEMELRGGPGSAFAWRNALSQLQQIHKPVKIAVLTVLVSLLLLGLAARVLVFRSTQAGPNTELSSAEKAYERAIAEQLRHAQRLLASQQWEPAGQAFRELLELDPINDEAREGLAVAERTLLAVNGIERAKKLRADGQLALALTTLRNLTGDGPIGMELTSLSQEVRGALAQKNLKEAQESCDKKAWLRCHSLAIDHLNVTPASVDAKGLVELAEKSMRQARQEFSPWLPSQVNLSTALQRRYKSKDIQGAALRYAGGDIDAALDLLRGAPSPDSKRFTAQLNAVREAKTLGDGALAAGDPEQAIHAWREALKKDLDILPEEQESHVRTTLRQSLSQAHNAQGQGAMARAVYGNARQHYQSSLSYEPNDEVAKAGIENLQQRAAALLESANNQSAEGCDTLQDILAMTNPNDSVHARAAKLLAACK